MKKYLLFHILFISVLVFIAGCKNNPVSTDQLPPVLYGQVVDSQGNPVEDVNVHYIFQFPGSFTASHGRFDFAFSKVGKICPSTQISFTIPRRTKVTVKVLRWYTRDTLATLINDTLDGGTHTVVYNASKLTNGFYLYQLRADTVFVEKMMVLLNLDASTLILADPLTKSNSSGAFELPYALLGFGIPVLRSSANGQTIDTVQLSPTIQMVLYKTGYSTTIQDITIDPHVGLKQTFILKK